MCLCAHPRVVQTLLYLPPDVSAQGRDERPNRARELSGGRGASRRVTPTWHECPRAGRDIQPAWPVAAATAAGSPLPTDNFLALNAVGLSGGLSGPFAITQNEFLDCRAARAAGRRPVHEVSGEPRHRVSRPAVPGACGCRKSCHPCLSRIPAPCRSRHTAVPPHNACLPLRCRYLSVSMGSCPASAASARQASGRMAPNDGSQMISI